jgi:hypothetical protein
VNEAAAIIRLCYPPGIPDAEWRWRSDWFRDAVLPRLFDQEDAELDVWVWVHPRHRAEIAAMDARLHTFDVAQTQPFRRHPISGMGYPWSAVRGLPRYPVQVLLGSDDLVCPHFLRIALNELARLPQPRALVHFQPFKYDVENGKVYDCGISVPHTGEYRYHNTMTSMFLALRQPVDDGRYSWVWARGHTKLYQLADQVQLVPEGHALLSVHRWNDSTKITRADKPLPAVDWLGSVRRATARAA